MLDYRYIFFDLDGTLTDPKEGITKSVQYALSKFGLEEEQEKLTPFIGPPLHLSFQHFYAMDEKTAWQAVEYYREYYADRGIFENRVYPGIPELLQALNSAGKQAVLATSKPTFFAMQVLRYFNLDSFFTLIVGSNMDGSRTEKKDIIAHIIEQLSSLSIEKAVMVGDRKHDIIGAQAHGMDSAAVAYGYGSVEELQAAGPTHLIYTVEELSSLLLTG